MPGRARLSCRVRLSSRWRRLSIPPSRVVVKPCPGASGGNNISSNGNFVGSMAGGFPTQRTHGSRVALLASGLLAGWLSRQRLSRLTPYSYKVQTDPHKRCGEQGRACSSVCSGRSALALLGCSANLQHCGPLQYNASRVVGKELILPGRTRVALGTVPNSQLQLIRMKC
jgi:hypothetical protein